MTDITDIKVLRSEAANIIGLLAAEGHQSFALDKVADFFDDVFRLLEAERQQREAAEAELAELRGAQEPVAWLNQNGPFGGVVTLSPTIAHSWELRGDGVTPLFTAPQKPVALPQATVHSFNGEGFYTKEQMQLAIEAAGGVVKDGE